MGVQLGSKMGKEIADMLGLKHTRVITIRIPYDDFVQVEVEALLDDEDGKLTGYMQTKRYKLELIGEDEAIDLFAPKSDSVEIAETTKHGDTFRTHVPRLREKASPKLRCRIGFHKYDWTPVECESTGCEEGRCADCNRHSMDGHRCFSYRYPGARA